MCAAVAESLVTGEHLLVEAPTGVGKSLAYLVPAVAHSLAGGDEGRVVVVTATKALQEQLTREDLPFLAAALPRFSFAMLKGRSNYLCVAKLDVTQTEGVEGRLDFGPGGPMAALERVAELARSTALRNQRVFAERRRRGLVKAGRAEGAASGGGFSDRNRGQPPYEPRSASAWGRRLSLSPAQEPGCAGAGAGLGCARGATMSTKITRREFVSTSTAAGLALGATSPAFGQAPAVRTGASTPVVVASANGNVFKNGGTKTGVQLAFEMMTSGGKDVLDALVAGVNLCELDPEESGVGYGGLPNADGVVQLDSCCMHGPTKRAGGVAALEGVRTPSLVAKAVLENTDHHLMVGKDAQDFARSMGFKIEDDLNTEKSRQLWLEWKRRIDPEHYLDPKKRERARMMAGLAMVRDGLHRPAPFLGHDQLDGVNARARSAA